MSVAVAKTRVLGDEPLGRASTSTSISTGTGTSSGGSSSSVKHQGNGATTTTTTFSFKIPTTPASASTTTTSASSSSTSPPANTPLKQRRVSLALPETPRVVEGWNFRDDTGLDAGAGAGTSRLRKAGKAAATAGSGTVASSSVSTPATVGSGSDGDQSNTQQETTAPPPPPKPEKKPRKKWTPEETQMLVDGCNKHGVGNWKTILRDPTLKFDNRSPVDLKDRFRTYFPDAYKQHYPNAKTHLSSKVRSTLPDGSSIFEKTRSKRRRPFTEEEDRALKEGYEKYGTVWATIVKDYPIFQEQNRRSTDLRDRFRNAFPELYQLAGYKPRNTKKKGTATTTTTTAAAGGSGAGTSTPERGVQTKKAAMDDQQLSTGGPVRSRRRAHTHQGLLRGGTKSVPQSTACSEDDDSDIESDRLFSPFKAPPTPPSLAAKKPLPTTSFSSLGPPVSSDRPVAGDEDEEMNLMTLEPLTEALSLPEIGGSSIQQTVDMDQDGQWSSGINTPTHSNHWSTAAGSPTSSHLSSDLLMNGNDPTSPFLHRHTNPNNNFGMIGKSAWGTDWFSPNPRLDPSSSNLQNANGSGSGSGSGNGGGGGGGGGYFDHSSPASPFSFNHLHHGVLDRYDLWPTTFPTDFSSEVGVGETHSTFSDDDDLLFQGNRGFTHHSSYAGDLIFGARPQMQGQGQGFYGSLSSAAVSAIAGGGGGGGFGFGGLGLNLGLNLGLGAAGVGVGVGGVGVGTAFGQQQPPQQSAGIHPMQLHAHGPSMLEGIDEGVGPGVGISVSDEQGNSNGAATGNGVGVQGEGGEGAQQADPLGIPLPPDAMDEDLDLRDESPPVVDGQQGSAGQESVQQHGQHQHQHQQHGQHGQHQQQDESKLGVVPTSIPIPPPSSPSAMITDSVHTPGPGQFSDGVHTPGQFTDSVHSPGQYADSVVRSPSQYADSVHSPGQFRLDDFVDLGNELHITPPATPLTHPRPMRRSSGSMLHQFPGFGGLDDGEGIGGSGGGSGGIGAGGGIGIGGGGIGGTGGGGAAHARSISVPPSEFRNPLYIPQVDGGYASALIDFDAVHGMHQHLLHQQLQASQQHQQTQSGQQQQQHQAQHQTHSQLVQHFQQQMEFTALRQFGNPFQSLLGATAQAQGQGTAAQQSSGSGSPPGATGQGQKGQQRSSPSSRGGSGERRGREPRSGTEGRGRVNGDADGDGDGDGDADGDGDGSDMRPQTPTLASRHLLSVPPATPVAPSLSSSSSSSSATSASSSSHSSSSSLSSMDDSGVWRPSFLGGGGGGLSGTTGANGIGIGGGGSTVASLAADIYNLPFLDLHYYGHGPGGMGLLHPGAAMLSAAAGGGGGNDDLTGMMDPSVQQMQLQAQALDLARSASVSSSGSALGTSMFSPFSALAMKHHLHTHTHQQQQQQHLHQQQQHHQQHRLGVQSQGPPPPQSPTTTRHSVSSASLIQAFGGSPAGPSNTSATANSTATSATTASSGSTSANGGAATRMHVSQPIGGVVTSPYGKGLSGGGGRSQSHHRGQSHSVSTVNPQELTGNGASGGGVAFGESLSRRKRASWDGMVL